ncbi:MAG: NOL1/NOP2/sun family putative RNA methylase, partial [Chloroflexi bacterium]|nr:NOL1/NOP2/sun family putative RNA methylase [Chloroflexota bacterium]
MHSLTQAPRQGLRVNTLKIAVDQFQERTEFKLKPVPWCPEGFIVEMNEEGTPGRHPDHAAGLYYLQDPSAMAATVLLEPQPGDIVLDMAAAPGGKSTHIAARLQGQGLLVSNEWVRGRVAALIENTERLGIRNMLVMNASPARLAQHWPAQFDRILVDAPCSGEGMFRKSAAARRAWRLDSVRGNAKRQLKILSSAAQMLRPGGRLVYATCTFAPEENEEVIARFLRQHPDFSLLEPDWQPGWDRGRVEWVSPELAEGAPLERCVRIWPHRAPAEGHFLAALHKEGDAQPLFLPSPRSELSPSLSSQLRPFWQEVLGQDLPRQGWAQYGDWLHLLPVAPDFWGTVRPVRAGLRLGKVSGGRFTPHHALALAQAFGQGRVVLDLARDSTTLLAYLR